MKERGMIFNGEMVRAILDGRKTQTRRLLKWKQTRFTEIGEREDGRRWPWSEDAEHACDFWHPCPFGTVGDRIWVRETFCAVPDHEEPAGCSALLYAADGNGQYGKWTPSIHMPRWASRITLEITGVRVERLASVSDEDAGKEGYPANPAPYGGTMDKWLWFRGLWDSIYPDQSFKHNPWVWVIEFKVVPHVQDNPA
ncbi:hypothetical protein RJO02_004226 [Enterobacter hormaechei]|uniref:hypothetical protein n=1 Tax=Enterobacter hormaechei TaxID=158836 RepID=UPI002858B0CA|nr:hypothetical protein [Enterobacter hormaechei]